jgi:hypothetical protein
MCSRQAETNKTPFYMEQHNVIFGLLNDLEKEINDPINKAHILNNLRLLDGINEELNQEKRAIDISINSEGDIGATSVKAYNLLKFSQFSFQESMLQLISSTTGLISGNSIGTAFGVIGIIGTFLHQTKKEYSRQDAKVLLVIYRLGKICHISTIAEEYDRSFDEKISIEKIMNSLMLLSKYKTIEIKEEEVEIIETVTISRQ